MRRALAISWVIEMAVAPSLCTQSTISPSITAPMMGSSPVVGSSKNSKSGAAATARASATRFCMPPDSSAGERSPTLAASPTWASTSAALSRAARRVMRFCAKSLKQTFSQTGRLSNSAPFWNSMPMRSISAARSRRDSAATSRPSIRMRPASGVISPRMHFSITDLPLPEPPSTTSEELAATAISTPSSTLLPAKLLHTPSRVTVSVIGRKTPRSPHNPAPE